jgi:chaperone required for assembly of F1-ATPase
MTGWSGRKVLWSEVSVRPEARGFGVMLDGRPLRTPAKAPLILPGRALADWVAQEWAAQRVTIDPMTMPATRIANSAIDRVAPQRAEVAALVAAYGASDLLCYRAEGHEALTQRQAGGWDPVLDWAARALQAPLRIGTGVVPVAQDGAALARLTDRVAGMGPFALAPFHDLVALSGSLILALAVAHQWLAPESAWTLSRIDEDWQAELWGRDVEAQAAAEEKHASFLIAARFYLLVAEASG